MMELSRLCNISNAPLSILLYLHAVLDRLLLANVMGLSTLLSAAMSLGEHVPFLVCSGLAHIPTQDMSVSMNSGLVSS